MNPDLEGEGIPEHIGPYRIEEQIGAGGMGAVYRAYDERLDRSVAIKRILAHRKPSESSRRRFLREARTVARLSHPAIVQVHDLQFEGNDAWIIMELVAGASLAERLRRGPLPIDRVVELGRQIAEGLDHAHRAGVLHRDLKTENVMVTPDGRAKILDFGLSKPMVIGSSETNLTHPGALLGTLRSMSPEQVRGLTLSVRSDLFSLGTLLYEGISGLRPFEGSNAADSLNRVCTHLPPPLGEVVPELLPALSELVDEMLAKEPTQRPESAAEVAERLELIGLSARSVVPTWETPPPMPALHATTRIAGEVAPDSTVSSDLDASTSSRPVEASRELSQPSEARVSTPHRVPQGLGWVLAAALVVLVGLLGFWRPRPDWEAPVAAETRAQPTANAPELLRRGQELLRTYYIRQDLDAAITTFEDLLVLEPESAAAHAGLSRALWRRHYTGNRDTALLEEALRYSEQAVELDPFLSFGRISLALTLVSLRRYDEAETQAEQVLTLEPDHADGHRVLADVQRARGQLGAAETSLRAAIAARSDEADLFDLLGGIQWRNGQTDAAEESFLRSVELAPESIVGHRNLAGVYYRQGRLSDAARQMQRALEIRPSASLYGSLGVLYFAQGFYPEAAEVLEKAVEVSDPQPSHRLLSNLGDAYRWSPGREEEARATYREAIEILRPLVESNPEDSISRSRLAITLAKTGLPEEARRHLDLLGPVDALTANESYRAAVAWEILGERVLGLRMLKGALEAGASLEEVERDPELAELREDPRFLRLVGEGSLHDE